MLISLCKTVILYFAVIISLRAMGKRQVGELETSELVTTILISELAAIPMQDLGIPLLHGIVPILTLLLLEVLISGLMLKFVPLRGILYGKASRLIHRGHMEQRELYRQRLSVEELAEELRILGYPDLEDVQELSLETNGRLSLIPKPGREPGRSGPCVVLINGTSPDKQGMKELGMSPEGLRALLGELGYSDPKQVLYLYVDGAGRCHCIPREDRKR